MSVSGPALHFDADHLGTFPNWRDKPPAAERWLELEATLFASRWLMAPFYLGLILALVPLRMPAGAFSCSALTRLLAVPVDHHTREMNLPTFMYADMGPIRPPHRGSARRAAPSPPFPAANRRKCNATRAIAYEPSIPLRNRFFDWSSRSAATAPDSKKFREKAFF